MKLHNRNQRMIREGEVNHLMVGSVEIKRKWELPGTLNSKWAVSIKSFPLEIREPCGEGPERVYEPEGLRDTKKRGLLYQHEQSSHELTETEHSIQRACTGLHQVLCIYIMASSLMLLCCSWVWEWVSPNSGAFSWIIFLLVACLIQLWCDRFRYLLYLSLRSLFLSNER